MVVDRLHYARLAPSKCLERSLRRKMFGRIIVTYARMSSAARNAL
jgi:hypothetical protein